MKKRGFGVGKLNGYGGKVNSGEDIAEAAARELFEEAGINCKTSDLTKIAEIDFFFPEVDTEKNWDQTVHVYFLRKWEGNPEETEEMRPEWHRIESVPLEKMWSDDPYWLPRALKGEKIKASFKFAKEGASVADYQIKTVNEF